MANVDYNDHKSRSSRHAHHVKFWNFFDSSCARVFRRVKNYTHDDFGDLPEPFICLCNHNTDMDPFLVASAIDKQAYFVASEHVMQKGVWSTLLMRHLCPIIHQKGLNGISSMRNMIRAIRSGYNIVLFPEGNRSFNGETDAISPATAKLIKKSGASLLTMRIEGGYLNQPRWSMKTRKGKMHGRKMHLVSHDELMQMSDDEIHALICEDLYENAFDRQRQIERETGTAIEFKGKQLAMGLESLLFMCPECGRIDTLFTHNDIVECKCGFRERYLPTGFLEGGRFETVLDWDRWQKGELERRIEETFADESKHGKAIFSDDVMLLFMGADHRAEKTWDGTLTVAAEGFSFVLRNGGEIFASIEDIVGMAIYSRNTIVVHAGKDVKHCEIRGAIHFNALKYKYAFDKIRSLNGSEEGE